MVITLGEASRQTGKSKAAIIKAIKTSRLSVSKGETGDWQIDPAELFRVYQPASKPENGLTGEGSTRLWRLSLASCANGAASLNTSFQSFAVTGTTHGANATGC
jgi:hypothetical protein